jgi:hypothetical protein
MRLTRPSPFSPRRLAWLLVLAILLPLAQGAANWHLLSHARADRSEPSSGDQAVHEARCALCLNAAAVTGGAIPTRSIALAPMVVPAEAPRIASDFGWFAPALRAYESRAPPFALI